MTRNDSKSRKKIAAEDAAIQKKTLSFQHRFAFLRGNHKSEQLPMPNKMTEMTADPGRKHPQDRSRQKPNRSTQTTWRMITALLPNFPLPHEPAPLSLSLPLSLCLSLFLSLSTQLVEADGRPP